MVSRVFIALLWFSVSSAQAVTVKDLIFDAESGYSNGDFFKSYRAYIVLRELKPQQFYKLALEGYLKTLFVLGGVNLISTECNSAINSGEISHAAKAAYMCGLHFLERRNIKQAEKYLKLIPEKSNFIYPGTILRASLEIIQGLPEQALNILKSINEEKYKKLEIFDLVYLTRARAYTILNMFDEAVHEYQSINSSSAYYNEALYETGWSYFKLDRIESSHILLESLISSYESAKRSQSDSAITPTVYYNSKYLLSYLGLVGRREGALADFMNLKNDYEKYVESIKSIFNSEKFLKQIWSENNKWNDLRSIPSEVMHSLNLIEEWLGVDIKENFKRDIYYQMALTREVKRLSRQPSSHIEIGAYNTGLKNLQLNSWGRFSKQYTKNIKKLENTMKTLSLKAELGRLEIIWLGRSEGTRSMDEVIDNYNSALNLVRDYVKPQ